MKKPVQNSEYAERIKVSNKMARTIYNSQKYLWTWLEGSVQVGKSVTAALAISMIIENSGPEDNLFIALGYTVTSAKNNIFECGGYGVRAYFGNRCEPCLYMGGADALRIYTKTGVKYLVAFGTSTKTANNAWHGYHVSGFIVDEIDRACEESIQEIQQRIVAVESPHIIATQNPNVPSHPIYTLLNNLISKQLVYYTHWTLDDNPALSPAKIQEIKSRYPEDSMWYKRYILGERCNPDDAVYNIRDYNIIDTFNPRDYSGYITICDPGENCSATAMVCLALRYDSQTYEFGVDVVKEYCHRNADERNAGIKLPRQYMEDYCTFIKECQQMFSQYPGVIYIDEDITAYRELRNVMHEHEMETSGIRYVIKTEISERIKQSINVLFRGKLRFYKGCTKAIQAFKDAQYDPKAAEKGNFIYYDHPELGTTLDLVDATCYGLEHYINKIYNK